MPSEKDLTTGFRAFGLIPALFKSLDDVGYETPSPIQAECIPRLLEGRDVVGQAHTGTGKTAAFALPLLSRIDLKLLKPQVFVLTPTRELAIQVAESFKRYASHMRGFHVLPIYGGQDYGGQIRQLKRGVHVVIGTPGRVMDHMRRGTLTLDFLIALVLDEADEMLRMGFIDDVEWILEQTPSSRQTALFSATMPKPIRRIAQKHLRDPKEITIKMPTKTAGLINQRYWMVSGLHKLDALTRILEAEIFDAVLIFVRTRTETLALSDKLEARGYACAPLNGELPQSKREQTINRFKQGKIDMIVATDVAARGLDVDRISHVINYDIPNDTESYVHRVGRTGRAGRTGEAILFVSPRERRMLYEIEKATKQKIALMALPTTQMINDKRIARFTQRITDTLALEDFDFYTELIDRYRQEYDVPAIDIAAALAQMVQGEKPLLLEKRELKPSKSDGRTSDKQKVPSKKQRTIPSEHTGHTSPPAKGMEWYRIEVGRIHGVKPKNIVGAIVNEIDMDSRYIGRVEIADHFSAVELPEGMPRKVFRILKTVWVAGEQLNISKMEKSKRQELLQGKGQSKQKGKRKRKQKIL
ncbi:DEAD/DEAH box helicase [Nitrospira defluvii]|nr:DEAD/DEAH box helicase [Nitrospira defluvii]